MNSRQLVVIGVSALLVVAYFGLRDVSTAGNTVPSTHAGVAVLDVQADDLAPEECSGLRLTVVIRGSGSIDGSKRNDLVLGSTGADEINGDKGDDCLVGGAGNDVIDGGGGGGHDVCIGGPGNDKFKHCDVEIQ